MSKLSTKKSGKKTLKKMRKAIRASLISGSMSLTLGLGYSSIALAQLFGADGGNIQAFTPDGQILSTSFIPNLTISSPYTVTASGSSIFVGGTVSADVGQYNGATGQTVSTITTQATGGIAGLAVDGSNLYVSDRNGIIGVYTTAGVAVNASLISLPNPAYGIAISNSNIYAADFNSGSINVFATTNGALLTQNLVTGLRRPTGIAISGSTIYVAESGNGTVGKYLTDGTTVNSSLISNLVYPWSVVVSGSYLYVSDIVGSTVGVYTTDGVNLNTIQGVGVYGLACLGDCSYSSMGNIVAGSSFDLASIGVSAYPVFDGGTLTLSSGQSSSEAFFINPTGGTIQSPTSGSATLSGIFSGTGGLTFTGTGTTIMSGANTYIGGTTVASGTLAVAGSSPTGFGDVTVNSGATLMGTGTINGKLFVAGTLKPGNSPGYLASSGNVTMKAGSTYQQDIAGTVRASSTTPFGATGYYSALNVTGGQFVINSGATLTPRLSKLFAANEPGYGSKPYIPVLGDRFRIITASGGISGKFSTLTQPAELAAGTQFLPFYNMANSNSLDLAVIPTSYQTTISAASGNKNAQSVGGALDKMVLAAQKGTSTAAQDQLLYATSAKNAASLSGYTQGLSGEVYPATVAVIAQTTQRVQQAVQNRLGDTMGLSVPSSMTNPAGNTALMGSTNSILNGGVASAAVSTNPNVNPNAEAKSFANPNAWGELAYQNGQRSSDNYSGGWSSNLYQLVFGSDFISANGMKLGGGLALSSTTLKPSYGSATIQQGSVFAYGKMPVEEFVVDAMASIGMSSSDISRSDVAGLGNGFRNKSVSGNDVMVSLGVSRPFDVDNFRVTPFARVTWQMVSQPGVNEGDLASALSVNSYTGNGVRGMLGLAAGSKANNPMTEQYTYRAFVGVGADSSGVLNPTMAASLAGMNININTPNAGTTFVQAGLYGTAKFADNAYAYAGLSGEVRSNQTLGTVNVGLRFQF